MNILHLTNIGSYSLAHGRAMPGDFGGGVAASLRDVTTIMKRDYGCRSLIGCCYDCDFVGWAKEKDLNPVVIPGKLVKFMGRPLYVKLSVERIKEIIEKEKIDIIHGHYFPPAFWGLKAAKSFGIPVVVTIHQDITDYKSFSKNILIRFLNLLRRLYLKILWNGPYQSAKNVIAVSNYVKEAMKKEGYIGREIDVVYNGIDTAVYKPDFKNQSFRHELGFDEKHVLIGSISRLDVTKGFNETIQAAVKIRDHEPMVRFIFVGEGEEKNDYLKLARELQVDDIITFAGFRSDISSILQSLDIFLMPTYHVEGFSIVLLEALSSGLPVIASSIGGNKECIEHDKTGILIEPRNVDAISRALLSLINDPEKARRLAEDARHVVKESFSITKQCEGLMSIYSAEPKKE